MLLLFGLSLGLCQQAYAQDYYLVSASTGETAKRYGFVHVDKYDDGTGDLSRRRKDLFYWYKKIIESNGTDLD